LPVSDTIGAGDRFSAGVLAALLDGAAPEAAVATGAELATALLRGRADAPVHHDDERRDVDATARVVPAGDA
jgi:sugar/nucleoside kinase (ribokinase family)